jgi:hypothetical protein
VSTLAGLLSHDNTDIAVEVIDLLQELTDAGASVTAVAAAAVAAAATAATAATAARLLLTPLCSCVPLPARDHSALQTKSRTTRQLLVDLWMLWLLQMRWSSW